MIYPGLAVPPRARGRRAADERVRRDDLVPHGLARRPRWRSARRRSVFTLAESLGGVESLVEHPHKMTHGSVAGTALEVPDDLVRLSVGIEDVDDLIADLAARARRRALRMTEAPAPPSASPSRRRSRPRPSWSWRLLLIGAALAVLLWLLNELKVVVVPIAVALLRHRAARAVRRLARSGTPGCPAWPPSRSALVGMVAARRRAWSRWPTRSIVKGIGELWDQASQGIDKLTDWLADRSAAADHRRHHQVRRQASATSLERRQLRARLGRPARDDDRRARRRRAR